jgi:cytochrome c
MRPADPVSNHSLDATEMAEGAEGDPIIEVALPTTISSDAEIGKRAFEAKCAWWHGVNAAGQNGVAPPLVHEIYEPNHHGDMAFVLAAKYGARSHHWPFGDMPPVTGLTDADVKYIARHIRELQKEDGIF